MSTLLIETELMNHQPLDRNIPASPVMDKRRRTTEDATNDTERLLPPAKRQCRNRVSWDSTSELHVLENPLKKFEDYDENDIWYSRQDYEDFLIDRLRTIQHLRASGGNEGDLDTEHYCIRGLEPFQTQDVQQEMHSKRRFHRSTILIEQVRQSMLGIHDPERFLVMVGPQSDISSRRAQELAALDEHEVYGRVCRRGSLLGNKVPSPTLTSKPTTSVIPHGKMNSSTENDLTLSQRIQRLQEWNARRLMEIYSQPGNNPFRFPLRRDSLLGSSPLHTMANSRIISNRFPIRRDSLTPMGTTGPRHSEHSS